MELFLIYLWLKLDAIVISAWVAGIFLLTCGLFCWGPISEGKVFPLKTFIVAAFCGLLGLLLPSAKDTAILVGASYAIDLAKSPEGQKIQTLIRKKANEFLDEQLKEEVKK